MPTTSSGSRTCAAVAYSGVMDHEPSIHFAMQAPYSGTEFHTHDYGELGQPAPHRVGDLRRPPFGIVGGGVGRTC